MKSLALCVPTYNHPDTINELLRLCIHNYTDAGMDIYIFDASETDETRKIVQKYVEVGYANLYYRHSENDAKPTRFEQIMSGEGLEKEYDYIWLCKDRSYVLPDTLLRVYTEMEAEHDVIFLGAMNPMKMNDSVYEVASVFYRDWAWLGTSVDVTIIRTKTMLHSFYLNKYPAIFGEHYILLFSQLAELEKPSISVLCNRVSVQNIPGGQSSWEKKAFQIWKDDWIKANELLPSVYDEYKDMVIKYAAQLPWILGGKARLVELYENGALRADLLPQIEVNWNRVSDLPFSEVEEIATGRYDIKHDIKNLPQIENQVINLLCKMCDLIRSGKMQKKDIPNGDISTLLDGYLSSKYFRNMELGRLVGGSIEDLLAIIQKYDMGQQDASNLMQALVLIAHFSLK